MGLELEWGKKIKCGTDRMLYNFFLARFDFYTKIKDHKKTVLPTALRERDTNFAGNKEEKSNFNSCNLPDALGELWIRAASLLRKESLQLKKWLLTEKEKPVFLTLTSAENIFHVFLRFSFSFFKQKYPHNWKTIFVHLLEKSNLLVRSDNNTGFSSWKVLQTTTI